MVQFAQAMRLGDSGLRKCALARKVGPIKHSRLVPPACNTGSSTPLYLQLRDTLAERIASGEWKPGRGVPSEVDERQVSQPDAADV
jgi:hypothetical protein